ncbi:unnamed protein product [Notodromas monacha]|uniref:Uncharacterized protein n=1 Tax=Notodromas monacha TaxID=399045 RepID=A0A7R9BGT9_9CRUS|nr:unnamed protein product [Notodromas monacha]CAG0915211.1 unnamed protein product [Notodromas monacha]
MTPDLRETQVGDTGFRQQGRRLALEGVDARHGGTYFCRAAVAMDVGGPVLVIREGNASIEVVVQHAPGQAKISLSSQFAVAGQPVTLTCHSDPPGWPTPVFEWWRVPAPSAESEPAQKPSVLASLGEMHGTNSEEDDDIDNGNLPSTAEVLSVRENLTLPAVSEQDEAVYKCRPHNRVGSGKTASFFLKVAHPPVIARELHPTAVVVQHAPGQAKISLSSQFAVAGQPVTLTCHSDPPGWPTPVFEWWRVPAPSAESEPAQKPSVLASLGEMHGTNSEEDDDIDNGNLPSTAEVLSVRENLTLPAVSEQDEAVYKCRPHNRVGSGKTASFFLKVAHPPVIARELHPTAVGYVDSSLVRVTSHLVFQGDSRPGGNSLVPEDRGRYTCRFTNPVGQQESNMRLRMQHAPIPVKQTWKFAAPEGGTAIMWCRAWAYPPATFRWTRIRGDGAETSVRADGRRIANNASAIAGDLYQAVLRIDAVSAADFGEYACVARNDVGSSDVRQTVILGRPGRPDAPLAPIATEAGVDWISVAWDPNFDGGMEDVEYVVRARPTATSAATSSDATRALFHCKTANPCNLTNLMPRTTYLVQVKAVNMMGESEFSDASRLATGLTAADVPHPEDVVFATARRTLTFRFDPRHVMDAAASASSSSSFSAVIDVKEADDEGVDGTDDLSWRQLARRVPLLTNAASVVDIKVDDYDSLDDQNPETERIWEGVRVRVCAGVDVCSPAVEAELVDVLPGHLLLAKAFPIKYLVAIVACCVVFLCGVLVIACCCCRKANNKGMGKGFQVDSPHVRPNLIAQQTPPPPYYTTNGDAGKPTITIDEHPTKANDVYGQGHQVQYGEHHQQSYSNSNNGGSVNSQDSLWRPTSSEERVAAGLAQVNGGAYAYGTSVVVNGTNGQHHTGFVGNEDYAHYPIAGDYGHDPYGVTAQHHHHHPHHQTHLHRENPYGNMSLGSVGLPELSNAGSDQYSRSQQPSLLGFNESMDSEGPASRGRRVIHEVIV